MMPNSGSPSGKSTLAVAIAGLAQRGTADVASTPTFCVQGFDFQDTSLSVECVCTGLSLLPVSFIHEPAIGTVRAAKAAPAVTPTTFSVFITATCKPGIIYSINLTFQKFQILKKQQSVSRYFTEGKTRPHLWCSNCP